MRIIGITRNPYANGTIADAVDVNYNEDAIVAAVNATITEVNILQGDVAVAQGDIADLQVQMGDVQTQVASLVATVVAVDTTTSASALGYTSLNMLEGGMFVIPTGVTFTIDVPFTAGLYQVFAGSGSVVFGSGSVEAVYPEWWGAVGDGSTDDSAAINKALTAMSTVVLTHTQYAVSSPLLMHRGNQLVGKGMYNATYINSYVSSDYAIKIVGTSTADHLLNCSVEKLTVRKHSSATSGGGIYISHASLVHLNQVFIGGTSYGFDGISLYLNEVWDSSFTDGYVHSGTNTASTVIDYGSSTDSSNNLRFRGWTWEFFTHTGIKFIGGSTSSGMNHFINFESCKIESSVSDSPLILVTGGALGISNFTNCCISQPSASASTQLLAVTGTGRLSQVTFTNTSFLAHYDGGVTDALSIGGASYSGDVSFINCSFYNWLGDFGSTKTSYAPPVTFVDSTAQRFSAVNCAVNYNNAREVFSYEGSGFGTYTPDKVRALHRTSGGTVHYLEMNVTDSGGTIGNEGGTIFGASTLTGSTLPCPTIPNGVINFTPKNVAYCPNNSITVNDETPTKLYFRNSAGQLFYFNMTPTAG